MAIDGFTSPGWLLLLGLAGALAAGYGWAQRRRRRLVLRFANLDLLDRVARGTLGWRRHASAALLLMAMLLLIVGLAGPTAAQQGINLGLVTFAGTATVESTPTTRREPVIERIRAARVHNSTATGEALATSLATIRQFGDLLADDTGPPPSRMIMISDGKQNVGRPAQQLAVETAQAHVAVDTISYGTDAGQITLEGRRIAVPPDDGLMRAIAEISGGEYHKATTAQLLDQVYRKLGDQVGYETVQGDASKPWFLLGTTALMVASAGGLVLARRVP